MTATARQFLAALASQIGYREGRDPDGNWNNDNKFGRWYGMNFAAWCAMFMSWGANEVGALGTLVPKYASCTAGLNWFRARGQTGVFPPRPGDIFILCEYAPSRWNAQPNGWAPIHTGAVERWVADTGNPDAGFIVTIEGNTNLGGSSQGNGVYRLQRRDTRSSNALIYCRPAWAPEPDVTPGGGQSVPIPKPTTSTPTIPRPTRYDFSTAIRVDDELLRKGKSSGAAAVFNARVWSWLYYFDRAWCVKNYAAWMKEPASLFGAMSVAATREVYRKLEASAPSQWDASDATTATYPGPALLRRLGLRAD